NDYYALMFDGITNHGGIVNLMIGDGLMAIFGAPQPIAEPALSAVHAARDMIALIEGFNSERIAHGKAQIAIGVGIATGEMIAGYAGTHQRATYTCIGDTVNLAARLEAHTKVAGRPILIDAETNAALAGRIPADPIGAVHFKGKSLAMEVFAV
ncbi:MAG: adenylate/guanylate cyclase domain-containing protein, partial [Quisquiliibacterium sp.]